MGIDKGQPPVRAGLLGCLPPPFSGSTLAKELKQPSHTCRLQREITESWKRLKITTFPPRNPKQNLKNYSANACLEIGSFEAFLFYKSWLIIRGKRRFEINAVPNHFHSFVQSSF